MCFISERHRDTAKQRGRLSLALPRIIQEVCSDMHCSTIILASFMGLCLQKRKFHNRNCPVTFLCVPAVPSTVPGTVSWCVPWRTLCSNGCPCQGHSPLCRESFLNLR